MTTISVNIRKVGSDQPAQFDGILVTWKGQDCIKYNTEGQQVTLISTKAQRRNKNAFHVSMAETLDEKDSFVVPITEIES